MRSRFALFCAYAGFSQSHAYYARVRVYTYNKGKEGKLKGGIVEGEFL